MIPFLIFLIVLIGEYLIIKKYIDVKKQKKFFIVLFFFEIVLFSGLRSFNVGADTLNYLDGLHYYRNLKKSDVLSSSLVWPYKYEIGYFWLLKICAYFRVSDRLFLIIISIIIYLPICIFVNKYSDDYFISVILFFSLGFFTYSVGLFRQMIAMSILCLSFKYVLNRNFIRFCICVGIAYMFHETAIVIFPLYFLYNFNNKKIIILTFLLQILLKYVGRNLMIFIFSLIPRYSNYIGSIHDTQQSFGLNLILIDLVLVILYLFWDEMTKKSHVVSLALCVAALLQQLSYSMGLFGRVVLYYSFFLILGLPLVIQYIQSLFVLKEKKTIWFIFLILLITLCFINIHSDQYVNNYTFLFSGVIK